MKLAYYINQLLAEHATVIVPGFGAFISNYKSAEIDEEGESIKPPSSEISFTTQFKNNDGLLVGHVAGEENISHYEALQEIEKERDDILYRLDKGEKIVLENLGVLYYDETYHLVFEAQSDENRNLESYGLGAAPLRTEEEEEEHIVPSASAETGSDNQEEEEEFEPVENTEPWHEDAQDRKKRNWLWLLLILIPLFGAGFYLWMVNDDAEQDTIEVQTEAPENTTDQVTEENVQTIPPADSIQEEIQSAMDSVQQIEKDSGYFLIAGSFKEEENVEDFMQELKAQGFDPFRLGKKGNFHLVGIRKYDTLDEAYSAQIEFLEKNPKSGAWVFYQE